MSSIKCETIKRVFKKGAWTREEDTRLITYINRYGIWNWCQMPKYAGLTRSGKSCRLRWINYLRPDVKRGNFTEEEDETIIKLYELLGTRWSVIAAKFPGRTDNEIKNRWHTHLKKRSKEKIWRSMASSSDCMTSNCDYSNQEKIVETNSTPSSGPEALRAEESEVPISSHMSTVGTTETVPRTGEASEIQKTKENSCCSFEISGDPHTSFWREPFSLENSYIEDYDAASVEFELPMLQESTNPYGFENSDYWFNLLTIGDFDGMIDYSNVCF